MTFFSHTLRTHKQLLVLLLWIAFVGSTMWLHALQSQQPPIHDAATYFQKASNFWTAFNQDKPFNAFNIDPPFRPPGTILMSYPFGFDTDYRGFYFRSIFLPVTLLSLAVVIGGYRRDLDNKSKWHLVLVAAFLSSLPCFYGFEVSSKLSATTYWGLVDNFLAGIAALATAATVRSIWTRSLTWLTLAVVLSSFCLLIKPSGAFIMMLIGIIWFGLTVLKLKSAWSSPDERKSTIQWLLCGMIIFTIVYGSVLYGSLTSAYLSPENLEFGNAAIIIMQTELQLSWSRLLSVIERGFGYPFLVWLFLMLIFISGYLGRIPKDSLLWTKSLLIGLALASCITFIVGIWFWIFGSGGGSQIRYFIPFALMTIIFSLPVILSTIRAISDWKMVLLSVLMIAPIINLGLLLPQRDASIAWQQWTGVNLTSGVIDPVANQAQDFATTIKREGRNVTYYSMSLGPSDGVFQSMIDYVRIKMSPMPTISAFRPVDWQRPSTYRKEDMLASDYWLFQPVRDPNIARTALATSSLDTFDQEKILFQAWATQLTRNEGITVLSETPMARIVRITDPTLLESAFDALVAKHHWRSTFIDANPNRRLSEEDITKALALNPPIMENINFENRFHLRAISMNRVGDDTTVRIWWKPLSPIPESDWILFIHVFNDDEGKSALPTGIPIHFSRSVSSLNGAFLFDQITIKNPVKSESRRLAFGFVRTGQPPLTADKGTRDWDNHRVIVTLP